MEESDSATLQVADMLLSSGVCAQAPEEEPRKWFMAVIAFT